MGLLGKIFYTTGKASATRPWTSIFIGLVIVAIGSIGFVNFRSTVSKSGHSYDLGAEIGAFFLKCQCDVTAYSN